MHSNLNKANHKKAEVRLAPPAWERPKGFLVLMWMLMLFAPLASAQDYRSADSVWTFNTGMLLTLSSTDFEKPFIQSTFSAEVVSGIGMDAGALLEL